MAAAIETERLILRPFADKDRAALASLNADPKVMEFLLVPLDAAKSDELADQILRHWQEHRFGIFFAFMHKDESPAGFIGLNQVSPDLPMAPAVEIAWRMQPDYWGRGLASEGALAVLDHGLNHLGLSQVVAFTAQINRRSQRVMEKIGMFRDEAGDFDHPNIEDGHPLQRHMIYRTRRIINDLEHCLARLRQYLGM